jgi:hypothetical protein
MINSILHSSTVCERSVADPEPDLQDPYVFGPPGFGSGSISTRYESGSRLIKQNSKRNLNSYGTVL